MNDVFVQFIVRCEFFLHLHKLLLNISLKRNEEQSGIKLTGFEVHTACVRIGTAQYF
ncbi:hypothetical protein D3C78_1679870 [compost metagenome]